MTTADEFKHARFATHPDGRIAARIDDRDTYPWTVQVPGGYPVWERDEDMATNGWSPLDETRPPSVVTDEMVDAAHRAFIGHHGYGRILRSEVKEAVAAALSAAPTTDEGHDIDWQKAAEDHEEMIEALVMQRDEYLERLERMTDRWQTAEAFAALWKETARRLAHDRRFMRRTADTAEERLVRAERQRDEVGRAHRECHEQRDQYEAERDAAYALNRQWQNLTAREHRDAMWARGHRPVNGAIPAGTPYMFRDPDGFIGVDLADHDVPAVDGPAFVERRLIDPPRPNRAEEFQRIIADRVAGDLPDEVIRALADDVAAAAGETVLWSGEDGEER